MIGPPPDLPGLAPGGRASPRAWGKFKRRFWGRSLRYQHKKRERLWEAVEAECGDDVPGIEDWEAKIQACKAARAAGGREPGAIRVGDTQEYVSVQWGPPDDVDTMVHAGGRSEWWRWCSGYRCYNHVHFDNGVVTSIHQ